MSSGTGFMGPAMLEGIPSGILVDVVPASPVGAWPDAKETQPEAWSELGGVEPKVGVLPKAEGVWNGGRGVEPRVEHWR